MENLNTDSPVFKTKEFPSLKSTNKSLNELPKQQPLKLNVRPFENSLTDTTDSNSRPIFNFSSTPKNPQSDLIKRTNKLSGLVTIGAKLLEGIKNKPGTFDLGLDEDDKKMKLLKEVENFKDWFINGVGKRAKDKSLES
jgi:hypothetical protein